MSDQRGLKEQRRHSVDPVSGSSLSGTDRAKAPSEPISRTESHRAVADLLSSKQDSLNRPLPPVPIRLTDLSRRLGTLGQRLPKESKNPVAVGPNDASVEPSLIDLSGRSGPNRSVPNEVVGHIDERSFPATGSQSISNENIGSGSIDLTRKASSVAPVEASRPQHVPPASEPTTNPSNGSGTKSAPSLPIDRPVAPDETAYRTRWTGELATSNDGTTPPLDFAPALDNSSSESSSPKIGVPRLSSLDRLSDSGNAMVDDNSPPVGKWNGTGSNSSDRNFHPTVTNQNSDLLSSMVRNPQSNDLRNLTMTMPTGPDPEGMPSGVGTQDFTLAESSAGQGFSGTDGGSLDLSRTNELLQQLVDAVRKQQGSSLPVGGPSVYPGR